MCQVMKELKLGKRRSTTTTCTIKKRKEEEEDEAVWTRKYKSQDPPVSRMNYLYTGETRNTTVKKGYSAGNSFMQPSKDELKRDLNGIKLEPVRF